VERNQIIESIYNSPKIAQVLSKMEPADLRNDLKQELAIIICKMPEDKLKEMQEKKYLLFYCTKAISQMIRSDKSSFYFKYRKFSHLTTEFEAWHEPKDYPFTDGFDPVTTREEVSRLKGYEKQCIDAYLQKRAYCFVSQETSLTLSQAKKITKQALAKVRVQSNPINPNNLVKVKVEIEIFVQDKLTPENSIDVIENLKQHIDFKLTNTSVDDGTFIYKTKDVRLV
jgi:hypothetical protein